MLVYALDIVSSQQMDELGAVWIDPFHRAEKGGFQTLK
jgi:hypothetical protein